MNIQMIIHSEMNLNMFKSMHVFLQQISLYDKSFSSAEKIICILILLFTLYSFSLTKVLVQYKFLL